MTRQEAIKIIEERIEIDREDILEDNEPESDFDKWVARQDVALTVALNMLRDPVGCLTSEELIKAYRKKEHMWDLEDIENGLELNAEEYIELFNIDKNPVTDVEKEDMACLLRRLLDKDADLQWSYCRDEAIKEVLLGRSLQQFEIEKRNEKTIAELITNSDSSEE